MNDLEAVEMLENHAEFFRGSPAGEAYGIGAQALRERADSAQMQKHAEPFAWVWIGPDMGSAVPTKFEYPGDEWADLYMPLYTAPPSKPELIEKPLAAGETFESEWVSTDSFYGNE